MKKIGLFLAAGPTSGGMFQYCQAVLEALTALPRDRFSIVAACASDAWKVHLDKYDIKQVSLAKKVRTLSIANAWRLAGLPVSLWRRFAPYHPVVRTLAGENCDLWIFPSQDYWTYQAAVPALGVVHDLMHRYERRFPEVSSWGRYQVRERHFGNICRWSQAVLVDSELGKRQVQDSYGTSSDKIFVLPYVIPKYIAESQLSEYFSEKYQLPHKFIFYPAQFWWHKNHIALIEAMARLRSDIPDIALVLVGSQKNAFDAVKKRVRELGISNAVHFFGYVPDRDMPEFYRRARALVMPTFFGPTNIPPLEAFALDCPVAVSDIYGMREQLGDAALFFDPRSVSAIGNCLRDVWTDDALCSDLRARGRSHARAWTQSQFNSKFQDIIKSVTQSDACGDDVLEAVQMKSG